MHHPAKLRGWIAPSPCPWGAWGIPKAATTLAQSLLRATTGWMPTTSASRQASLARPRLLLPECKCQIFFFSPKRPLEQRKLQRNGDKGPRGCVCSSWERRSWRGREHHNLFLIVKPDLAANFTPIATLDEEEGCCFSRAVAALLKNTILCMASPTSIDSVCLCRYHKLILPWL